LTLPVTDYGHKEGCTVIGGNVDRGTDQPALGGGYLFADYCSGRVWAIDPSSNAFREPTQVATTDHNFAAFGEVAVRSFTDLDTTPHDGHVAAPASAVTTCTIRVPSAKRSTRSTRTPANPNKFVVASDTPLALLPRLNRFATFRLQKDQGPQPNRHAHRGLHHTCPLKIEEPVFAVVIPNNLKRSSIRRTRPSPGSTTRSVSTPRPGASSSARPAQKLKSTARTQIEKSS